MVKQIGNYSEHEKFEKRKPSVHHRTGGFKSGCGGAAGITPPPEIFGREPVFMFR